MLVPSRYSQVSTTRITPLATVAATGVRNRVETLPRNGGRTRWLAIPYTIRAVGVHEHREQEPGRQRTLAAESVEREPAARDGERAGMAGQDPPQAGDRDGDQQRVLEAPD